VTEQPFRLLVVCTANICRSPMLAAMATRLAQIRDLPLTVSSAGFMFDNEPASPTVREVMAERDFDLGDHRSRIVSPVIVEKSDLVLTMERGHARELVLANPTATAKIHTAAGFAAGVSALQPEVVHGESPIEIVARVAAGRPSSDLLGVGADEIADPHGRHRRVHRDTADQLERVAVELVTGLFPF